MTGTQRDDDAARPARTTHLRPRTRTGRAALVIFLGLFALTQPPVVHGLADRIEPMILGMPFLYAYLLGLYLLLVGVLVWARIKGL